CLIRSIAPLFGFTPVNQTILPFSELVCVLLYGWT
ncbi:hypothetical protein M078_2323, partial [Bacteroides fragilis str. 2-F-2 